MVMEQVPGVISSLRARQSAQLGFYEQGVERILVMEPEVDDVVVECQSMTAWQPVPRQVRLQAGELLEMLTQLLETFVIAAQELCPEVLGEPEVRSWLGEDRH
ncbi:MAG: hypothetical protein IPI67_17950 [Myxococcales bacterium]|nr:hypothetical protein [Myxococcales bacterium]